MNTKFKVGKQVECILYGEGKVTSINNDKKYPVVVEFEDGRKEKYSHEGVYLPEARPTLSPYGWEIKEKQPEFETGERVWCYIKANETWNCRYYSHYERGLHFVFEAQKKEGRTIGYVEVHKFDDIPF